LALPHVCILAPNTGAVTADWGDTLYRCTLGETCYVSVLKATSSFSSMTFNLAFAEMLQRRDAGRCDYFAMVHSDVAAEAGWLDRMLAEMHAADAGLISAVMPIKEPGGRTSTAIGVAGNRWVAKRFLSLDDLAKLPPTFGPEHVCEPGEVLLVNNGCMVARADLPCWDSWEFNTYSRIVKRPDGGRHVEGRSEDYEMSHHIHDAGVRYVATYAVSVGHQGFVTWPNQPKGTAT
jgi:hypothetical protein